MAAANFLNNISKAKSGYKNFDSLEQGIAYKIHSFSTLESTAYDKQRTCVRVNIEDGYLILPERFDACYNKLKTMDVTNLYIIYNGRNQNNRLEIDFEERDDDTTDDNVDTYKTRNKNKRQRIK